MIALTLNHALMSTLAALVERSPEGADPDAVLWERIRGSLQTGLTSPDGSPKEMQAEATVEFDENEWKMMRQCVTDYVPVFTFANTERHDLLEALNELALAVAVAEAMEM